MEDLFKLIGHINIRLFGSDGALKEERNLNNLIVTAGKNALASWLAAASQSGYFMPYIGLGEGLTAPTATDTTLQSPLATRVSGTISSSTNIWQNQATFGAGINTGAITEAGLFSAVSGGTMLARQVFAVVNKQSGDSIVFTWQITIS
jgi:hypothetical protein